VPPTWWLRSSPAASTDTFLNTDRTPGEWRNKMWSNVAMLLCAAAFAT
jgi:hypothetical protein